MTPPRKSRSRRGRSRNEFRWRLLRTAVVVLVLTPALVGSILWWSDRPLREIERALDRKQFAQALRTANTYLAEFPERSQALDQKARALAGLGRWSEAGRIFERVGVESAASRRAWSQALLQEQRWSEALPLLTQLDDQRSDDPDLLQDLATCHAELGDFDESVRAAERLLLLAGQDSRGRLLLGMLHYRRGNSRLAIETWQPLIERMQNSGDLHATTATLFEAFGKALLAEGRTIEARSHLERAVRLNPTADAQNALADAFEREGDLLQAVALWRQIVVRNPADRDSREGLARSALASKAPDEARTWLEPLLHRDDLKTSTAYLMQRAAALAGDSEMTTKWQESVQRLRAHETRMDAIDQALRESPRSFWSRAVRAHRFASSGNTQQALRLTQELLNEQPDQAFVLQLAHALRDRKPLPSLDLIPGELIH